MILQALNHYYQRCQQAPNPKDRLPAFGLEEKEIPFLLVIDPAGRLVDLRDTRTSDGKKLVGKRFLVPQGVKKTSGVAANLFWDSAEYVLGVGAKGKPERLAEQHAAFRARIEALPEAALADAGVQAILAFYADFGLNLARLEAQRAWPVVKETNPLLTFRLQKDFDPVCQRPAVVAATQRTADGAAGDVDADGGAEGICLVSGEAVAAERLHPAIKGVWGAQSSGANIVSFNLDAFNSYGKTQGANAPLGPAAVFAYTTALNHLLGRGSRQRIQVGDASTVFWAEAPHALETMLPAVVGEAPKDDPNRGTDALQALYSAVESGRFAEGGADTPFHVLGLAPNAARIAVRFWQTGSAKDLACRVRQHFEDAKLVRPSYESEHLSLFRMLCSVAVQNKADNIPPNLGGEVMRSILAGTPYPDTLLSLAVQRCRAEQKPTYARAATIKAALNRAVRRANLAQPSQSEKEFTPMLDETNIHPAYRLGRLFATLEKIQEEASPGLNATIRDRYYSAASSTPSTVFSTLLRLKNHHLGKLPKGREVQMEKLVTEIIGGLDGGADFPRNLSLPQQGRFALGYYHQRQAFFTKTEKKGAPQADTQADNQADNQDGTQGGTQDDDQNGPTPTQEETQ